MKRVYRSLSASAAHQWIDTNIKPHEERVAHTTCYDEGVALLDGAFNKMVVVTERIRVPFEDAWKWRTVFSVYHSDNDGGERDEVDLVAACELRA